MRFKISSKYTPLEDNLLFSLHVVSDDEGFVDRFVIKCFTKVFSQHVSTIELIVSL